jgi:SAM-dependent methyltransferase
MPEQTADKRSLRRSLNYLNWLYNPFQTLDVPAIYDMLSTSSPTEHALYLNLGYWPEATDLDQASVALATLVGEQADMQPGDQVLDCGFGFADQDILWAQILKPERIIGLNITRSQVNVARRRVAELGLDQQIDLRYGSATDMPLANESVDKVVAMECAFHFNTREQFFREAWRVLRPGGRLVTADIIPMPTVSGLSGRLKQRLSWGLVAGKFAVPSENAYTRPTYHAKLAMVGFTSIRVDSIRDQVYAPLHQFLAQHLPILRRLHPLVRLPARFTLLFDAASVYGGLDYVLATAVKPKISSSS